MNRRHLLQSLAALGLVVATPEPVRRFWALDQTMVARDAVVWANGWPVFWAHGWHRRGDFVDSPHYDASMVNWRKEFVAWQAKMNEIGQPHPEWFTEGGITRISDDDVFERYDSRGDPFAITFVNGVYSEHPDHPTLNILL